MVSDQIESYLAAADAAGLLYNLGGSRYVAGLYNDIISGDCQCLVEYCTPDILANSEALYDLRCRLLSDFPDIVLVRLRARTAMALPAPWERAITYMRCRTNVIVDRIALDPRVRVMAADDEQMGLVEKWLLQAYLAGYRVQDRPVRTDMARAQVRQILSAPDRRSYVALVDEVPVGHVTLLEDAVDEVTGEERIELVDMLAEPGPLASPVRRLLVRAAAEHAQRRSIDLLGNVVHGVDGSGAGDGQRVVHGLRNSGWNVDHVDWRFRRA